MPCIGSNNGPSTTLRSVYAWKNACLRTTGCEPGTDQHAPAHAVPTYSDMHAFARRSHDRSTYATDRAAVIMEACL